MYCTIDDVKAVKAVKRLIEPNGNWSDSNIEDKIDEMTNLINTRIAGVAETPLNPVPSILQRICKLKTAYEMLIEEYGKADGKYAEFNNEAEYLLARINERVIVLDGGESIAEPVLVNRNSERYFA